MTAVPAQAIRTAAEPRRVTVLGSTGSVGGNTVDLLQRNRGGFVVEALVASTNVQVLAQQARALNARMAVVADPARYADLKEALAGTPCEPAAGPQAVAEAADRPADWVMSS